jgi:outer membrane protein OmpA-like peptidoglycan-associated protein/tetratricopeptide (TPR) repeat protein
MKKIYILFTISIISSLSLIAQNDNTKKADKHFSRFEYVDAARDYLDLVKNGKANTYVYSRLADCYYNVFNTIEAERWYSKALADSQNPETIYKYAQMLKANGKFDQSNEWMSNFAKMRPGDIRALSFKANPDYLPKILEKGKKFNVKGLEFNSENSDFGGTLQDGKLYMVSARNNARKTYGWNEEPYLDILEIPVRTDGSFGDAYLLGSKINTKYHEGTVSFSPDGKTMYFSRESFYDNLYEKDSITNNKFSVMNLFKATKTDGVWDNVMALPFNSNKYNISGPSLSKDGKTLYFHSDMPGGFGLADIYKAEIKNNGSFGEPVNLGQKINTEGQERFPFIASDGSFYFSSDGHLGLGGLDVFFSKEIDGKMAPVRNIGIPVNSNADDFAFTIYDTGEGFVSSNRMGGRGSDDIYSVKKLQPICDVLIAVNVIDSETGEALSGVFVNLSDASNNTLSSKNTDDKGNSEFMIECETDTQLQVSLQDYESKNVSLSGTRNEEVVVNVTLDPIEKLIIEGQIVLNPIYFDFDKSNITSIAAFELDKLVQIMTKYPELVINATSHTDSRGSDAYNLALSDRRAKTTVQYVISKGIDASRISGEGKGEKELLVKCGFQCTEEDHQMNRRSEFIIVSGKPEAQ